jgi:hypothetical protein
MLLTVKAREQIKSIETSTKVSSLETKDIQNKNEINITNPVINNIKVETSSNITNLIEMLLFSCKEFKTIKIRIKTTEKTGVAT